MKRKIREAVVVEGRYDKNAVSQLVDTLIIETRGFGLFTDGEKMTLIRRVAEERGVIIFTDPDSAGFIIRNRLRGSLPPELVKHAYVPDVPGKERRKPAPSKEGKLGVEGVPAEAILEALVRAGATFIDENENENAAPRREGGITKADMYDLGLTGRAGSAERRRELLNKLGLPERMTANALLEVINSLMTREELIALLS